MVNSVYGRSDNWKAPLTSFGLTFYLRFPFISAVAVHDVETRENLLIRAGASPDVGSLCWVADWLPQVKIQQGLWRLKTVTLSGPQPFNVGNSIGMLPIKPISLIKATVFSPIKVLLELKHFMELCLKCLFFGVTIILSTIEYFASLLSTSLRIVTCRRQSSWAVYNCGHGVEATSIRQSELDLNPEPPQV